jgi:hypothetical protein
MSSRANREKYRNDGPAARRTAAVPAAIRPAGGRRSQQSGTMAVPISAGASRAVKSESPATRKTAAVR